MKIWEVFSTAMGRPQKKSIYQEVVSVCSVRYFEALLFFVVLKFIVYCNMLFKIYYSILILWGVNLSPLSATISSRYNHQETYVLQASLYSGDMGNFSKSLTEKTLFDDFYIHRIMSCDFHDVKNQDDHITESKRMQALTCILEKYDRAFLFEIAQRN